MCFCNPLNSGPPQSGDHTNLTYNCFPVLLHAAHSELSKAGPTGIKTHLDPRASFVLPKHLISGDPHPSSAVALLETLLCPARKYADRRQDASQPTALSSPVTVTGWPSETPRNHFSPNKPEKLLLPGILLKNEHADFICHQRNNIQHTLTRNTRRKFIFSRITTKSRKLAGCVGSRKQETGYNENNLLVPHCPGYSSPKTFPRSQVCLCFTSGAPWRWGPLSLTVLWVTDARHGLPSAETSAVHSGVEGVGQSRSFLWHAHTPYVPVSTNMHRANSRLSSSSYKRQRGGIQDSRGRETGTYSCSRGASPLNACLSIDWISFLYR